MTYVYFLNQKKFGIEVKGYNDLILIGDNLKGEPVIKPKDPTKSLEDITERKGRKF